MRYDVFVEEGYNTSRISDTYKKAFICILLKHSYIPHINNLLLIPDLFDTYNDVFMTSLLT